MSSTSRGQIAVDLRRSSRIGARPRSTCGVPISFSPLPMAAAPPRPCVVRARPSRWSGPGRLGSWRRASKGCCATRRVGPAKPPLSTDTVQRVVDLALGPHTGGSNPLDRPGTCQGGRGEPAFGATHSRSPPACAASCPDVQAVERPGICQEAQGHRRPLCRSSR